MVEIASLSPHIESVSDIKARFASTSIDPSWSFEGKTRKETTYITHGYHSYPAKFIPPLAARLIEAYSDVGDVVLDPFMGCGTTLVEAKVLGRPSIGTDINPLAALLAQAKTTSLAPLELEQTFIGLKARFGHYDDSIAWHTHRHERIDYWFQPTNKNKLAFIYHEISRLDDSAQQAFFWCAFSNILKSCSIWMQKSNKPTRDFAKTPAEPFQAFYKQVKAMLRGNAQLYDMLAAKDYLNVGAQAHHGDARAIPTVDESVQLVVTSPPYVTSYEYADLHQLSTLWLKYAEDLAHFRQQFIGTAYHQSKALSLHSPLAQLMIHDLSQKNAKMGAEVANYFGEMYQVFSEMRRVLKPNGKIAIVIGNTALKKVDILNAEVFTEQLQQLGFQLIDLIKREIPSKNLPSIRDESTGRFAKISDSNTTFAYPTEYIIVLEKQA